MAVSTLIEVILYYDTATLQAEIYFDTTTTTLRQAEMNISGRFLLKHLFSIT